MIKNSDTRSKEELLKLLYNLKSEDSCILKKIETDKKELEDKKENVEQQKLQANEAYLSLKKDEECALLGAEYAEDFFNVYEENEVLRHYFKLLNVDFDPQAAKDAVNAEKKSQTLQKSLTAKIDEEATLIEKLGNEHNDLEIKISEASEQISDYEHTRAGVESLVIIVFSVMLIFEPTEHHAMIHLYLLLAELIVAPLTPLVDESITKYKLKKANQVKEENH